jgi:hypothetical protein
VSDPSVAQGYEQQIQSLRTLIAEASFPTAVVVALRDLTCLIPEAVSTVKSLINGDNGVQNILRAIKVLIKVVSLLEDVLTIFTPTSTPGVGNAALDIGGDAFDQMATLAQALQMLPTSKRTSSNSGNSLSFFDKIKAFFGFGESSTPTLPSLAISVPQQAQGPGFGSKHDPSSITNPLYPNSFNGAVEPIGGACNRVVPHPTDATTMWVATTNGGIWKSTNANTMPETGVQWTPVTDSQVNSEDLWCLIRLVLTSVCTFCVSDLFSFCRTTKRGVILLWILPAQPLAFSLRAPVLPLPSGLRRA